MLWLLLCAFAFANEEVITLKKGDIAPFAGTLLTPSASAQLLANGEANLAICLADAKKDKAILVAKQAFEIQTQEAKLARCTFESAHKQELYSERIAWLEKKTSPPSWQAPILFGSGIVIGITTIIISAWTLDKIQEK